MLITIDHVQLAMPPGGEAQARAFYGGVLGMREVPKPEALRARGGCWFVSGGVQLHLGVEADFRPARKAHPGLVVDDLDAAVRAVEAAGLATQRDDAPLPGFRRMHVFDPFGNRLELLQPTG